jgi:hypothetical protein
MTWNDILFQASAGYPFQGSLSGCGTQGPFGPLPSGFTVYAVAFGVPFIGGGPTAVGAVACPACVGVHHSRKVRFRKGFFLASGRCERPFAPPSETRDSTPSGALARRGAGPPARSFDTRPGGGAGAREGKVIVDQAARAESA